MLKIFINNNDVTSGTIPLSWCLDEEDINLYSKNRWADPYIGVRVVPLSAPDKEQRFIAPIKDLMMYIPFSVKGKNTISAKVCYSKHYASMFLKRYSRTEYMETYFECMDSLEVDVPEECFAPDPPEWEQYWVNYWFEYKAQNQCEYRRRRIIAYTFQPIAFVVNYILRILVTLVALFIGFRNVSLQPLLHPLSTDFDDVISQAGGGTIFIG